MRKLSCVQLKLRCFLAICFAVFGVPWCSVNRGPAWALFRYSALARGFRANCLFPCDLAIGSSEPPFVFAAKTRLKPFVGTPSALATFCTAIAQRTGSPGVLFLVALWMTFKQVSQNIRVKQSPKWQWLTILASCLAASADPECRISEHAPFSFFFLPCAPFCPLSSSFLLLLFHSPSFLASLLSSFLPSFLPSILSFPFLSSLFLLANVWSAQNLLMNMP